MKFVEMMIWETSMMVLMMFGGDDDNDNIDDGVDEEYDTGVSECVNSTHAPDSFYCPSSVLSGHIIITIHCCFGPL